MPAKKYFLLHSIAHARHLHAEHLYVGQDLSVNGKKKCERTLSQSGTGEDSVMIVMHPSGVCNKMYCIIFNDT